jgi:transposase
MRSLVKLLASGWRYPVWKIGSTCPEAGQERAFEFTTHLSMKKKAASARPKTSSARSSQKTRAWQVVHPRAAGIDVGAAEHFVAVPPDSAGADNRPVRKFKAFTAELDALVEWLKACQVDTVALESTGVYWIPLVQKLESGGIEAVLVDARAVKHAPGRKSDVQDCQWLQQLHSYGLLRAAFRPDDAIYRLRTLVRHRQSLISSAAEHIQHMQKALVQMNIHLHQVVSHLNGETGLRILRAIIAGERDPEQLVKLRDPQISRSTPEEMKAALQGDWREEALFVLQQSLSLWDTYQQRIRECDRAIKKQLEQIPTPAPATPPAAAPKVDPLASQTPKRKRPQSIKRNDPRIDLRPQLARLCGLDLTAAHGMGVLSVLVILSEIGLDLNKWRSAKAFASWLGLCPNNKISGGRVISSHTRQVNNRAAAAFRMAAVSLGPTETWLGSFHRRMKGRLGEAGAVTATAHKLAMVVYHLLKHKEAYLERDLAQYEARIYKHNVAYVKKKAKALGMKLVPLANESSLTA